MLYTDDKLSVRDERTADEVSRRIDEMAKDIVRLTAPKNKELVRLLVSQVTFGNMQLDRFEYQGEVICKP